MKSMIFSKTAVVLNVRGWVGAEAFSEARMELIQEMRWIEW
jgi:hypothetical protein